MELRKSCSSKEFRAEMSTCLCLNDHRFSVLWRILSITIQVICRQSRESRVFSSVLFLQVKWNALEYTTSGHPTILSWSNVIKIHPRSMEFKFTFWRHYVLDDEQMTLSRKILTHYHRHRRLDISIHSLLPTRCIMDFNRLYGALS
jgi:hypothetical protein